ncbi:MAG: hypothetical protein HON84_04200 [Candidatus Marinimicrobia bacterium]|nr:hypothetical protein [Candidatus Neomarinimicrobiota bacterium]
MKIAFKIITCFCFTLFIACDVPEFDFNEFGDADPPALLFDPFLKKVPSGTSSWVDIEALQINGAAGIHIKMEYDPKYVSIEDVVAGEFFKNANQPLIIVEDEGSYLDIYTVFLPEGVTQSVNGSGVVVSVEFKTLKKGKSKLIISDESRVVDAGNSGILMNTFGYFIIDAR